MAFGEAVYGDVVDVGQEVPHQAVFLRLPVRLGHLTLSTGRLQSWLLQFTFSHLLVFDYRLFVICGLLKLCLLVLL